MNLGVWSPVEGKLTQMSFRGDSNQSRSIRPATLLVLVLALVGLGPDQVGAAEQLAMTNGVTATIYSALEIENSHLLVSGEHTYLEIPGGGRVELEYGDRQWFPMDRQMVAEALSATRDRRLRPQKTSP